MAAVIAAAVRDRQVPAGTGLEVEFDGDVVRLDHEECVRAADAARATRLPHNTAAPVFRREIVAAPARRSVEDTRHLADRLEADIAEVLAEADLDRAVRADLDALPGCSTRTTRPLPRNGPRRRTSPTYGGCSPPTPTCGPRSTPCGRRSPHSSC
ncbi:hypothetical protein [Streptomyces sp. NPDC057909]|uniref:hypothetical protein n=1 Tax=Streptomyces sp. NPDC057909 TaxID=3346277 RepID=UPI0036F02E07